MKEHLMRGEGLAHKYPGYKDAELFAAIDATGGWPLGYQFIGFEHSDSREAGFCNSPHNSGWWAVVASADDYYMWKLSPEALQRITDAVVSAIRLPSIHAESLWIKNYRGHRAEVAVTLKATP